MKSSNYWRERTLQGKVQTLRQAEREIAALDRDLARAARELREAAGRILQTLQADPAAARRRLTDRQRTATLRDYYRLVERALGGDAHADALLDLAEKRRKITRLDALLLEVDGYTGKLYRATQGRTERLLRLTADSAYYRQVFGFERGLGQYEFTRLNPGALEALLREDWSGRPWSDRLWGRVRDLDKRVKGAVRQGFLQGWGVRELQAELQVQTGQTRANVRRLARTEAAHAAEQAALLAYEDAGVARYEFSATLDAVTSPACRALDGKTFPVADARVGENYPPMHPNCRSTTLPVVDGVDETQEVRAVRDPITGARQTVPASWDYGKWYEERVRKGGGRDILHREAPKGRDLLPQMLGNDWAALDAAYRDALVRRFDGASDLARRVFAKVVPPGSVADWHTAGRMYFDPGDQRVRLNVGRDLAKNGGLTFFHEHGHLIDHAKRGRRGWLSSRTPDFEQALRSDFQAYVKRYRKAHGLRTRAQAYQAISDDLWQSGCVGASDIISGLTMKKCYGSWSHKQSYWKSTQALPVEAFANMFAALFDAVEWDEMRRYFPHAWREFERLIGGI